MNALDKIPDTVDPALAAELDRLAGVAATLARRIARGGIDEQLGGAAGVNSDGNSQKALDVIADQAFMDAFAGSQIRHYASEEQESVVTLNPEGRFALAIDPLDGSSNIDTNVSIGTIFGLYPAADEPDASFLRPGRDLLASGYAIFGPQCALVFTTGDGVLKYVLDPESGVFRQTAPAAPIPEEIRRIRHQRLELPPLEQTGARLCR